MRLLNRIIQEFRTTVITLLITAAVIAFIFVFGQLALEHMQNTLNNWGK